MSSFRADQCVLSSGHSHTLPLTGTDCALCTCAGMTLTAAMTVELKTLQTLCPLSPSSQWAWARSTCPPLPMSTTDLLITGTSLMATVPPHQPVSPILFLRGWGCVWTLRRVASPFTMLILSAHSGRVQSTALLPSAPPSASSEEGLCSYKSWWPIATQIKHLSEESPSNPVSLN